MAAKSDLGNDVGRYEIRHAMSTPIQEFRKKSSD